jgi:hypothetical protein
MKNVLNRFNVEKPETRPDVKLSRPVKSTSMTGRNLTTLGSIELVLSIMCLLALSQSMRIGSDNLNDHK